MISSFDTNHERVQVRGKDCEAKYLYRVNEIVNTDKT